MIAKPAKYCPLIVTRCPSFTCREYEGWQGRQSAVRLARVVVARCVHPWRSLLSSQYAKWSALEIDSNGIDCDCPCVCIYIVFCLLSPRTRGERGSRAFFRPLKPSSDVTQGCFFIWFLQYGGRVVLVCQAIYSLHLKVSHGAQTRVFTTQEFDLHDSWHMNSYFTVFIWILFLFQSISDFSTSFYKSALETSSLSCRMLRTPWEFWRPCDSWHNFAKRWDLTCQSSCISRFVEFFRMVTPNSHVRRLVTKRATYNALDDSCCQLSCSLERVRLFHHL